LSDEEGNTHNNSPNSNNIVYMIHPTNNMYLTAQVKYTFTNV